SKDMVLGCYYLTMDPSVEIVTTPENAERFRSIDAILSAETRVGIAERSNGYYFVQNRQVPGMVLFHDITEEDDTGRIRTVESAIDRTIRAVIEGEVDCMLANAYEMQKYMQKKKLGDKLEIANLHERRKVIDMDEVEYLYRLGMVNL